MVRGVITVLAGLLVSTLGYYALHGVDFSSAQTEQRPTQSSPRGKLVSLPRPANGKSPTIRVCLTSSPVSSLRLQIDGPFALRVLGSDQTLGKGPSLKECGVQCDRSVLKIGNQTYATTRLEIVPQDSPAIWVNGHQYRGRVRLFRQPGGKILAVNALPVEDYLASVIDSEMPAAFPDEARKAQAICSRTYALYQMAQSRSHPYFDVYASPRSQNYLGYQYLSGGRRLAGETADGRQIAQATAGLVSMHEGQLFCTYYSAVCGGRTTKGDLVFSDAAPPLQSVPCQWCRDAKLYRWTEKLSPRAAANKLASLLGTSRRPITAIHRSDRNPLTPASLFQVTNGQQTAEISAADLRRRLSLPSATFQVWQDAHYFHFQGRGHGHGIGLCQWGARGLALAGKTAAEILRYYYPGSQVVALPW